MIVTGCVPKTGPGRTSSASEIDWVPEAAQWQGPELAWWQVRAWAEPEELEQPDPRWRQPGPQPTVGKFDALAGSCRDSLTVQVVPPDHHSETAQEPLGSALVWQQSQRREVAVAVVAVVAVVVAFERWPVPQAQPMPPSCPRGHLPHRLSRPRKNHLPPSTGIPCWYLTSFTTTLRENNGSSTTNQSFDP